ncbi:hypothetical protein AB1Y20_012713 [Prymnesium parvum]|uniref:RNA helicase n=1 Tax=Prymnesium parvum TaxID=97485 RepID=A0AB34IM75_PRYPA
MPPRGRGDVKMTKSKHKVVLTAGAHKPFGSMINQSSLRPLLESYGRVWSIDFAPGGGKAFVTFKSTEAVEALVKQGSIAAGPLKLKVEIAEFPVNDQKAHEDERLAMLFSKPSQKPKGIVITETRSVTQPVYSGSDLEWRIVLQNKSTQGRELLSIEMPQQHVNPFKLKPAAFDRPIKLPPGGTHTQIIKFVHRGIGQQGTFNQQLLFNFSNWVLEHVISITVTMPDTIKDMELLKPTVSYTPKPMPSPNEPTRMLCPAFPPGRVSAIPGAGLYTATLEHTGVCKPAAYEVPANIVQQVEGMRSGGFNPWKTKANYRTRFHDLLWLEEATQQKLTRQYDLVGITIEKCDKYWDGDSMISPPPNEPLVRVECHNLSEKRPSVQRADRVLAYQTTGAAQVAEYEGFVHRVEGEALVLIFAPDFLDKNPPGTRMNIQFSVERTTPQLMHRAVDDVLMSVVWPEEIPEGDAAPLQLSSEYEGKLPPEMSDQQRSVVEALMRGTHGTAPFLLFGPFGTGKTRTLNEFLKLLLEPIAKPTPIATGESERNNKRKAKPIASDGRPPVRVLVCSPSNSAADKYVLQLASILPHSSQMLRVFAPHRSERGVHKTIKNYVSFDKELHMFTVPALSKLQNYAVIVTTTRSAAMLVNAGVSKGHFTHIIVDEAAQLMESEALIPLSLAGPNTSVVMAGDPQQLGPSTFTKVDSVHGLHLSIMERLANLPVYETRCSQVCMHLTKNYRSHPAIVKLLSKISYNNRLEPMAPNEQVTSLQGWAKRDTKASFPMLFCGLEGGREEQEGDSPSYFNRHEASTILVLISDLLNSMKSELRQEEIGVITPFYKQTQKLRMLLRTRGLGKVYVGSTEEFHGHEVRALFISTVRTSTESLERDSAFDTGFVGNVKRFNTALSRAVALAVIVGDATVLSHGREWAELISYCRENHSFLNLTAPSIQPTCEASHSGRAHMSGDASKVENMAGAATDLASSVALTNDEPTNGVLSAANGRGGQRAKRLEDFPGNDVGKAGQDESASTPNYGRPIDVQALLAGNTSLSIPLTVPTDGGPDPLQRDPEPEEPEPLPEWAQDHVLPPPKDKLQLAPNVGAIEQGRLMRAHDADATGAVVSQKQDDAVTTKCIFDYESVGVVFVTGPIPQLAIYDNAESLKLVISTFNLECQLDENDQGATATFSHA